MNPVTVTDPYSDPYSDETLSDHLAHGLPGDAVVKVAELLLKFPADRRPALMVAATASTSAGDRWWKVAAYLGNVAASEELDAAFPRPDETTVPDAYLSARYLLEHLTQGIARAVGPADVEAAGSTWFQMSDAHPQGGDTIPLVYHDGNGCTVHLTLTATITKVENR